DLVARQPRTPVDCNDGSITDPCFVEAGRALYTVCVSAHWLIRWSWPGLEQLALHDQLRDMTEFAFAAATDLFGTRLAVRTDGGIVLWDVVKDRLLMTIQTDAGGPDDVPMAFSLGVEGTFAVGHGNTLRLYDVRRGKLAQAIAVDTGPV